MGGDAKEILVNLTEGRAGWGGALRDFQRNIFNGGGEHVDVQVSF